MEKSHVIGGIDEAGRGAVLGPMVIAGVSIRIEDEAKLRKLGVKDSKMLSPSRRTILAREIEKVAKDIVIMKVSPCKIDSYSKKGVNLNQLEAMKMAEILDCIEPGKAFVDSPENNTEKFKRMLTKLTKAEMEVVAEHRADQTYPVVSAASIIAKVERDKAIVTLQKKYGVEGSGYPSDERTIHWMKAYLREHGSLPKEGVVRYSWDTTKQILKENKFRGLKEFFGGKKENWR